MIHHTNGANGGGVHLAPTQRLFEQTNDYIECHSITLLLLKHTKEERLLVYSVESTTEKIAVFVHDNLFYTISGNVPSTEMKKIIDSFEIEK